MHLGDYVRRTWMIEDYNNTNGDYYGYSRSWINLSLKESQPLLPCKPNVCATFQCNRFLIALSLCVLLSAVVVGFISRTGGYKSPGTYIIYPE